MIPEVFAPNLISNDDESEFGAVFNQQGTAFYYGVDVDGKSEIRYSQLEGDYWTTPQIILSHEKFGYNDPFLSPDEKRLYFISKRSMDGSAMKKDHDIWYVEKNKNGWSTPINAGPNINSDSNEYYISFTDEGKMYFSSNKKSSTEASYDFDIYTANYVNGKFQEAVALGEAINTEHYEADVYIDPTESYMIFCASRPDGLGQGDLYISFKNKEGAWTKSKNMGSTINTKQHELCPFVTKDGKYFLYTSNQDIYWVDAKIIDQYRN